MQLHLQPRLQGTRKFQTRRALTPTLCRAAYTPPSSSTAQSELAWLETHSTVVQDTFETASAPGAATAATVSAKLLYNLSRSERLGLKPLQNALTTARTVDRNPEKQVERALVNVGAVLSTMVSGRVSTEVDPRLAHDKAALIAKAKTLAAMYKDLNIPANRLLFRLPATWQGVCAARELEAEGINTQLVMVYSLIQGVAAAQAGASVITPRVGKTRDWFTKHPGVIRDPKGPRQDAGAAGGVDPGINLVTQLYNYIKVHHPKTQIMATGIRSREDALALSGCDFLLLPTPVISTLDALPTTAGYNDGLSAAQLDDDALTPALSPAKARAAAPEALPPVTEASFSDGLGYAGNELLSLSLADALKEVDLLASMNRSTTGITST